MKLPPLWLCPSVLQMEEPSSLVLQVKGMSCASCTQTVKAALMGVPGVLSADVNLATAQVRYFQFWLFCCWIERVRESEVGADSWMGES